ncbi:glycosyltransferase family 4 protein [Cellulomonas sp. PhB143]|uniref:glycosyltransferase family 4 protein n=1 Tax=Cellulomonas sp. PhB143 TaxID=2485186 RepID=UPI000F49E136|nr:glycosyltransferase family 4 protein [Cellulomonas sp. PhB143]ROS74589.1 phosphatidylinositol alpha-mannosyltransferase [Cellulomonas sp. PhB143]
MRVGRRRGRLRVGIVCPYSFDVPGGVQFHVRDLAEALIAEGHEVSVLAPADDGADLPDWFTTVPGAIPVRYNGSVARLTFGPRVASRVRRWLETGDFDLIHLHEPVTPSLSILALWATSTPVVVTCHSALVRSRALQAALPLVRSSLEKIDGRIAVSEDARRTVVDHLGGDAVVIPNGVYVDTFARALPDPRWTGTPQAPTVAFLGRLDEPRKGLPVLTAAVGQVLAQVPGARFLVAGRGDAGRDAAIEALGPHAGSVEFLGSITDEEKASLLSSVDLYVAPQTGGESFGIVLVEAMSAGACVVASNLGAFRRVLDDGAAGALFEVGDGDDLARAVLATLGDRAARDRYVEQASRFVRRFDWSTVTAEVVAVYETVLAASDASAGVRADPTLRGRLGLRRRAEPEVLG